MGEVMSAKVKCKCCGKVMKRPDWDVHQCPAIPKPKAGESFEDYKKRCAAFRT
jgi:hypothetical protein